MDPNTNPLGATPTPAPEPAAPTNPADGGVDALADLGKLAGELNNYNPATDSVMAPDTAPVTPDVAPVTTPDATPLVTPETAPVDAAEPAGAPVLQPSADLVAEMAAQAAAQPTDASAQPAELPEDTPVLQPSADLAATATVSAAPNLDEASGEPTTPSPLENIQPLAPENPTETAPVSDSINPVNSEGAPSTNLTSDPSVAAAESTGEEEALKGRVKAAAPVPGSIGSMKSYSDIQREEAERQAKAAAAEAAKRNGKKPLNTTTIIIGAAAAVVAIIAVVVTILALTGGGDDTTADKPGSGDDDPNFSGNVTTLICDINMRPEEFAGMPGVLSAKRIHTFGFTDDFLSSLKTEQIYYMDSAQSALEAKNGYDSEHPEVIHGGEIAEPDDDKSEEDDDWMDDDGDDEKNPGSRYSLENVTTTASGATYTFTRYVSEDTLEAWLSSEWYSDAEYGLVVRDPKNPDESRTINGYKSAQNSLGYKCTITEE